MKYLVLVAVLAGTAHADGFVVALSAKHTEERALRYELGVGFPVWLDGDHREAVRVDGSYSRLSDDFDTAEQYGASLGFEHYF